MMIDLRKERWWPEMFDRVGVRTDQFPAVYRSTEAPHRLAADAASALGIPGGIPVALGGGDRSCEGVGAGLTGDRASDSTGTATQISMVTDRLPEDLGRSRAESTPSRAGYLFELGRDDNRLGPALAAEPGRPRAGADGSPGPGRGREPARRPGAAGLSVLHGRPVHALESRRARDDPGARSWSYPRRYRPGVPGGGGLRSRHLPGWIARHGRCPRRIGGDRRRGQVGHLGPGSRRTSWGCRSPDFGTPRRPRWAPPFWRPPPSAW